MFLCYNIAVPFIMTFWEGGENMGKASTKAQNKYIEKKYDRINLVVEKGKKEKIKEHAESRGESVNGFINRAIDETINRDKE